MAGQREPKPHRLLKGRGGAGARGGQEGPGGARRGQAGPGGAGGTGVTAHGGRAGVQLEFTHLADGWGGRGEV